MRRALTAAMAAALATAVEHGGQLEARTWGAWTYPGAPKAWSNDGVPDWFHRRATVEALVARGEMRFTICKTKGGRKLPIAAEVVS